MIYTSLALFHPDNYTLIGPLLAERIKTLAVLSDPSLSLIVCLKEVEKVTGFHLQKE